jgi:hypothetical protein
MSIAANIILFQIGWFACVLGAAHGVPWVGPVAMAAITLWHLSRARYLRRELLLLAGAAVAGLIFDSALMRLGLVRFSAGAAVAGLAPLWMIALWILFATTLNVSLRWLHGRPAIAVALGLVGGALAYYSGARLGALVLTPVNKALPVIALGWAASTPLLLVVARRFDGFART